MEKENKHTHFATRQIHGGRTIDETCSRGSAIHPSAAFHFKDCQHAADLFNLTVPGNIYSRITNPTWPHLYGGTYNLFRITLRKLGIDCRIAPTDEIEDIANLIDENTRLLFAESMGNPTCHVADLEALAALSHRNNIPFVVDNTFGGCGYLCNPFDWGADIVVESATKWINGHGNAIGGMIVDRGKFDWSNGKFPS